MADLNRVTLVGRLTRDSELKYANTATGEIAVCRFAIAVNRFRKSSDGRNEEASFFDVALWGRAAESLHKYLVKGKQVAIDGELRQDRWTQDGQPRSKVEIVARDVQLLGGNQDASASGGQRQAYAAQPGPRQQAPQAQAQYGDYSGQDAGADGDFPDDIPF